VRPLSATAPALVFLTMLCCSAGCESTFTHHVADAQGSADGGSGFSGAGVGGKCADDANCRQGLHCKSATCQATASTALNGACLLSAECGAGLHCGWSGFCTAQPGGTVAVGQGCTRTGECGAGLYCAFLPVSQCPGGGTCGVCKVPSATDVPVPGEECTSANACPPGMVCDLIGLSGVCKIPTGKGDLGTTCSKAEDCLAGLACSSARKQCVAGSLFLDPDLYPGVECNEDGEAAQPFQAVVHLPRANTTTDFYALPFPNDIRRKNGHVDVSGHPHPGLGLVGFDSVQAVMDALAGEMTGFGLTSGMYVRFTRALEPKSLTSGPGGTVRLVNLTNGTELPVNVHFSASRNKYICGNWLYAHAAWSRLLDPGATYALLVTDGVTLAADQKGDKIPKQTEDMAVLVSDASPKDDALVPAWKTYEPLRAWLKKTALPGKKVIAAAQFTTWEPRSQMAGLATVAQGALPPGFANDTAPVACGPGVHSPCATPNWAQSVAGKAGVPDPRDCPQTVNPAYTEVHARIKLPYFQTGERPYLHSGGALKLDGQGKPALVDYESVCMAITVPKTPMPAGGWPLLVFAHGTGGSFRSVADGVAAQVSALVGNGGAPIRYATLGIDQPMHGNRRGAGVETDPGPLFYNFANPPAARGNFYQGAADNFTLFRFAKGFAAALPGVAGTVKFDPANLVYMGHSQGGTTGPMFLPYQPGLKGAVLSGCGGSLVYGLLGKKKPYDASVGLRIALQDAQIDEYHPVLNLLQFYFEASDPLLYAPLLVKQPVAGVAALNMLHTYGQGDSFTPPATSRIFAAAAGGALGLPSTPPPSWFDTIVDLGMATAALPIASNLTIGGKTVTAATIEATNDAKTSVTGAAYDGHFVAFHDKDTVRRVATFLATLVQNQTTVPK
jgi:hypothetical protein